MTPPVAIDQLRERGALRREDLDAFVAGRTVPIVEGPRATFLFRGHADAVFLQHWIFGLTASQPFQRLAGTDLWWLTIDVPENSRIEYKLEVVRGEYRELVQDPLNPREARDPFGANSVLQGAGYEEPEWVRLDPEARRGTIEDRVVESRAFGDHRRILVYLPARFRRSRRYPLLVVHDGRDYLRYAAFHEILDNLIHRLEIPPLIAVFVNPGQRLREYAADPAHARFVVHDVVPAVEAEFPLRPEPRERCLMGASFGAVASLATAWMHPGSFGHLLLQSGSFAFTDIGGNRRGPAFEPVVEFMNRFRAEPGRPAERLFVSCGMYESLIYENRSMVPLLQRTGMTVRYVESRDGHNWENWRDRLREGLSWLFPGPLWMVYE